MSRILVTGANGFIGSAVVRRLMEDGHDVLPLGRDQLDLLTASEGELVAMLAEQAPAHCIHAAWYTNHSDYLTNDINREWTRASLRLARAFADAGGQRFAGLGTCLEYDVANADGPCDEGGTPLRPDSLYARCKLELCEGLERSGFNFAWARIFFVYGSGDRAGRLFPGMIERLTRGEEAGPTFGGLRRDYVHVDDLAGQLVRIAASDLVGAINTGTGEAPTLSEVFAAAARMLGHPELACANDEIGGRPPLIQADLGRFRDHIGDPAARDVATGLGDLIG